MSRAAGATLTCHAARGGYFKNSRTLLKISFLFPWLRAKAVKYFNQIATKKKQKEKREKKKLYARMLDWEKGIIKFLSSRCVCVFFWGAFTVQMFDIKFVKWRQMSQPSRKWTTEEKTAKFFLPMHVRPWEQHVSNSNTFILKSLLD